MPISGRDGPVLLDTSAAVAFVMEGHDHHGETFELLVGSELGLAGHAAFETVSVLTRLPSPSRLTPSAVLRLMSANFPQSRFLSTDGAEGLLASLGSHGISGGAVYDALVGAAALEHGLPLATRDRRALDTYRALGVAVEVIP
jgi:predicted nucleic acid-binding protein